MGPILTHLIYLKPAPNFTRTEIVRRQKRDNIAYFLTDLWSFRSSFSFLLFYDVTVFIDEVHFIEAVWKHTVWLYKQD